MTPLDYFLLGHMKSLIYEAIGKSEVQLLARVMAAADIDLPDRPIGDRVYQNIVRRYRAWVEVTGCHIEPFLKVDSQGKKLTVSSGS